MLCCLTFFVLGDTSFFMSCQNTFFMFSDNKQLEGLAAGAAIVSILKRQL
jgi:hypothetical protein